MTDIEMLELVASSIGLHMKAHRVAEDDSFLGLIVGKKYTQEKIYWNPLTDDGDAFRLAVRLGMVVGAASGAKQACAGVAGIYSSTCLHHDPYTATRRAIVEAAVGIAKRSQCSFKRSSDDS